jgi:chitodextrinase
VGVTGYTVYRGGTQVATVAGSTLTYSDTTVAASTTYSYTVNAFDAAGNHSAQSSPASVTTPAAADTQPPSVPTGVGGSASSSTQVNLSWSASTDNVGVTGYTVYRGGAQVATVAGSTLTYSDTSVAASTTYSYTVDAFDAAGNHSAQSSPASVTTPVSSGGHAAFVQAGATSTGSTVTSTTIALSRPVAQGDLLVGWFAQYNSSGQVSVSDSVNGAWQRVSGETFGNGGGDIALYYLAGSRAAPSGLTVTISSSSATYLEGSAAEYSGVAAATPLDQAQIARGNSQSATGGPTAAVAAGELVFGAITTGGNPSSDTPGSSQGKAYVLRATTGSGSAAAEDILASASGAQTAGFTLGTATDWYVVVATFRSA